MSFEYFKSLINYPASVLFVVVLLFWLCYSFIEENGGHKMSQESKILRLEFEVFGKVQGVFFRKYTQKKAIALKVRGWIRNTESNSVEGELEGDSQQIAKMKDWLKTEGSPSSRIDKSVFKNERQVEKYSFKETFEVRR